MVATIEKVLEQGRARRSLPEPDDRRLIRERAGVSQHDVANALGVTRPTITRYEVGRRTPRGELAVEYARLLERLRKAVPS
jgi:DNA-binding XRE family transcriptional regulator